MPEDEKQIVQQEQTQAEPLMQQCHDMREAIERLGKRVRVMKTHNRFTGEEARPGQLGEMQENLTLALRHLEDARMRLGKVMQHGDDGVSIYDQ